MKKNNKAVYGLVVIICIICIFPIYWMIITSIKTDAVLMKYPPEWFPLKATLENYRKIITDIKFINFYKNTIIISITTTVASMLLSIAAGYSFSRFKFFGSKILQMIFLSTQMFPAVVLVIALYTMYNRLGLINTYTALVLACTTNALPLGIWVLKGFYDTIPKSLEEAAYIDGCGKFKSLVQIIAPLTKPGILAVSIYAFLISWDDFLWGLTLVNKVEMRNLAPGIAMTYLGEYNYDWAKVMAASVSASIPVLIIFIFLQKHMISGLTAGAVKG